MVSSVMTVGKKLVAFDKVTLAAGEKKTVSISLQKDDFALINANCEKVVEPGEFVVMAGKSSKDEDLLKVNVVL